jgi:hypothetical protein
VCASFSLNDEHNILIFLFHVLFIGVLQVLGDEFLVKAIYLLYK